jgi:hypothetical protein
MVLYVSQQPTYPSLSTRLNKSIGVEMDKVTLEDFPYLPDCSCTPIASNRLTLSWLQVAVSLSPPSSTSSSAPSKSSPATSSSSVVVPPGRAGHSLTWCTRDDNDTHGIVALFGGNSGQFDLPDLYFFDIATSTWTDMKSSVSSSSSTTPQLWPAARSGHTMISYGHRMYLYGGQSVVITQTPAASGSGKKKREATQVVTQQFFDDCWMFDMKRQRWLLLKPNTTKGSIVPPQRNAHSACVIGKKMWVFGGSDNNGPRNDVYSFHLGNSHCYPLPFFVCMYAFCLICCPRRMEMGACADNRRYTRCM